MNFLINLLGFHACLFGPIILGYLGFGLGVYIGVYIGFYLFRYKKPINTKVPEIKSCMDHEPETLKRILHELPIWFKYPDFDRVDWLNRFIEYIWPYINKAIHDTEVNFAKPFITKLMKNLKMEHFHTKTFTLGSLPPTIQGMKVYATNENELIMELSIKWAGNSVFTFTYNGDPTKIIQVVDLQVFLLPRITLKPLIPSFPYFANIYVSIMEKPHVDFGLNCDGADYMSIPGFCWFAEEYMKRKISRLCLWHKTLEIQIIDLPKTSRKPLAILNVKVLHASKLKKRFSIGAYVKLKLTDDMFPSRKTTVKSKMLNLEWNEEFNLVVKDPESQVLEINVYACEQVEKHNNIGMNVIPLKEVSPNEPKRFTLNLYNNMDPNGVRNEKSQGQIVVELTYEPFKEETSKSFEEKQVADDKNRPYSEINQLEKEMEVLKIKIKRDIEVMIIEIKKDMEAKINKFQHDMAMLICWLNEMQRKKKEKNKNQYLEDEFIESEDRRTHLPEAETNKQEKEMEDLMIEIKMDVEVLKIEIEKDVEAKVNKFDMDMAIIITWLNEMQVKMKEKNKNHKNRPCCHLPESETNQLEKEMEVSKIELKRDVEVMKIEIEKDVKAKINKFERDMAIILTSLKKLQVRMKENKYV